MLIGASGLSGSDETTPEDRYVADADTRLSDVHDVGEAAVARLNEEEADADADPTGDTDPSDDGRSGDDGTTKDDEAMPSGSFTGTWDDPDPGMFANNPRATGSFESISVEVSGETWTIETAWSTTIPSAGPARRR